MTLFINDTVRINYLDSLRNFTLYNKCKKKHDVSEWVLVLYDDANDDAGDKVEFIRYEDETLRAVIDNAIKDINYTDYLTDYSLILDDMARLDFINLNKKKIYSYVDVDEEVEENIRAFIDYLRRQYIRDEKIYQANTARYR